MSTRLKALLIGILIVGLATLSIYFINYERAFQNKGELLLAQGHKTYVDPGYLVHTEGSKQGALGLRGWNLFQGCLGDDAESPLTADQ